MKILLISVGTRGDMEPFLPIGKMLEEKGHDVICAFPEQFRDLAEVQNLEFFSLGSKFIQLLDSEVGRAAMGGTSRGLRKLAATIRLAKNQTDANRELVIKQDELIRQENPDRIVYNGKAINPLIWEAENKGRTTLISPVPYIFKHAIND